MDVTVMGWSLSKDHKRITGCCHQIAEPRQSRKPFTQTNLGMCVEELKQGHDQLFDSNVSVAIFLDVVAHGLSLRLSKKVSGLFL